MSRFRKPTAIHILKGSNPTRMRRQGRQNEPESLGPLSPTAPEWMSEDQAHAYKEVVSRCHKDVLCVADTMIVELVAVLVDEMRRRQGDLSVAKIGKLMSGLDRLGMTPAARSKVQAMKRDGEEESTLSEFVA
jgi:phage terminase small subunit